MPTNAYRDEIESLRARAELLEREAASRDAELAALRERLAQRDALFEQLRTVVGTKPPRRRWPFAVAGALASVAVAVSALTLGRAPAPAVAAAAAAIPPASPATAAPAWGALPQVTSCGASYVAVLHEGGAVECLNGESENSRRTVAEILHKPDGTPYLIVGGYDAKRSLDIVGPVRLLPGEAVDLRVRVRDADGSERESTSSRVRVTRFGAVGEPVEGEAFATMVPRLNEAPEQVHVVFSVPRAPDRRSP